MEPLAKSPTSQPESAFPAVQVVLRPIATPLSLGFLALAIATFTVAGLELSWVSVPNQPTIGLIVLVVATPLQFLSAVFGFLARDPVAAAGMGVLAGTWAAVGVSLSTGTAGVPSGGLGLLLIGSAVALLVPATAATLTKGVAAAVMAMSAVRFGITGGYELTGSTAWHTAAGVAGLVLAAVALYAALAFELEGASGRTVLPTLRRGRGRSLRSGDVATPSREVSHEPGVRPTL